MNGELMRAAVTGVYETAHTLGWQYGNSETLPPCADGIISCDRGAVSRPLWILGYDPNDVRKNSIVLMRHVTEPVPDWKGHAFFVLENNNGMVWKYDFGSQGRIDSEQPFYAPLNEWDGKYEFFATYWWPEVPDNGIFLKVGD